MTSGGGPLRSLGRGLARSIDYYSIDRTLNLSKALAVFLSFPLDSLSGAVSGLSRRSRLNASMADAAAPDAVPAAEAMETEEAPLVPPSRTLYVHNLAERPRKDGATLARAP